MEYAVASDETGNTTSSYQALAVPMVYVIDRSGTVREVMVGYDSAKIDDIEALLDQLVRGP